MKLVAVFMLFGGIAMLSQSSVGGKICSPVADDVFLFTRGSKEAYIKLVKKHTNNQKIIENAEKLKTCVDMKLTEEEKDAAFHLVKKINDSKVCR
ncbi:major allergen I polypeptide chain 1-like [Gracilinanus agilis]|uniref:major allergen I polypeptide chain 1-like n=1 Tax=Gracilinanus agilis TaxID=191870 RepID=UPI001CFD18C9|nr:major allergen I polypeptide chain 1-like [Gracilinanus agilis]